MCRNFILADIRPMGISFHAVVVFGLGKNFLFISVLGRCESAYVIYEWYLRPFPQESKVSVLGSLVT